MKRKLYKEAMVALVVILIFDFLRLFYSIYNNLVSFYDFAWLLLLIVIILFNYKTNKEDKLIHIFSIIAEFLPLLFTLLLVIQVVTTGLLFDFNNYFIIFETFLITIIAGEHLYEYLKQRKEEINE
ncbi:MAG: hypothetical protein IJM36_04790 [Acholeplasmatales bacterium]|nr:hypothetical protein [Acholeplasmatales bacterium]